MHKQVLLEQRDTISVFKHLKYAVKYTFDVDGLTKIAFESLRPFPRRKDISIKQTYFLKMITETWQTRLLARNTFFQQEKLYNENYNDNNTNTLIIECATFTIESKVNIFLVVYFFLIVYAERIVKFTDEIWICYGGQYEGNVMFADIKAGKMHPLKINVTTQIVLNLYVCDHKLILQHETKIDRLENNRNNLRQRRKSSTFVHFVRILVGLRFQNKVFPKFYFNFENCILKIFQTLESCLGKPSLPIQSCI
jgi:hypothetical protein